MTIRLAWAAAALLALPWSVDLAHSEVALSAASAPALPQPSCSHCRERLKTVAALKLHCQPGRNARHDQPGPLPLRTAHGPRAA